MSSLPLLPSSKLSLGPGASGLHSTTAGSAAAGVGSAGASGSSGSGSGSGAVSIAGNTAVDALHAAMEHVLAPVLACVSTIADIMCIDASTGLDWRLFLLRLR